MTEVMPIRVILVDDHAVVRKGIREFLEDEPDITVVAEAADGAHALTLIRGHTPDVVVLDIQMPGPGGIEVTRTLRETGHQPVGEKNRQRHELGSLPAGEPEHHPLISRSLLLSLAGVHPLGDVGRLPPHHPEHSAAFPVEPHVRAQ